MAGKSILEKDMLRISIMEFLEIFFKGLMTYMYFY